MITFESDYSYSDSAAAGPDTRLEVIVRIWR
jgi:hypothetical protein